MKKLLAIDANSLINRSFYAVKNLTTSTGFPTNAIHGFFVKLEKILNEVEADFVVAAFDLKAKTFRHDLFKNYKSNRSKMPSELSLQIVEIKTIKFKFDILSLGYWLIKKIKLRLNFGEV